MVRSGEIDQVFVTFPLQEAARLADVQDWLGDEPVTLFYVPDWASLPSCAVELKNSRICKS